MVLLLEDVRGVGPDAGNDGQTTSLAPFVVRPDKTYDGRAATEHEPTWVQAPCMVVFFGTVPSDAANPSYPFICPASVGIPVTQVDCISRNTIDFEAMERRYTQSRCLPDSVRFSTLASVVVPNSNRLSPVSASSEAVASVLESNRAQARQGAIVIQVQGEWKSDTLVIPFGFAESTEKKAGLSALWEKGKAVLAGMRKQPDVAVHPARGRNQREINHRQWEAFLPILAWLIYIEELWGKTPAERAGQRSPVTSLPEYPINTRRLDQIRTALQDAYRQQSENPFDPVGPLATQRVFDFLKQADYHLYWSKIGAFV